MQKVELLEGRSDTRKFYQQVKRLKQGYTPPTIRKPMFWRDGNSIFQSYSPTR